MCPVLFILLILNSIYVIMYLDPWIQSTYSRQINSARTILGPGLRTSISQLTRPQTVAAVAVVVVVIV